MTAAASANLERGTVPADEHSSDPEDEECASLWNDLKRTASARLQMIRRPIHNPILCATSHVVSSANGFSLAARTKCAVAMCVVWLALHLMHTFRHVRMRPGDDLVLKHPARVT